ncbi:MAG: hypothetical protein PHX62_01045 [Bacilli bacterium]|nr:hypothetical protein [Bacilli bacterium]
MKKQLSLSSYRFIDIFVFTALTIVFELLSSKAVFWFNEFYYVSLFIALSLIVMMRWGAWALITIIAAAITYCLANNASFNQYIIYIIGNSFLLFNLFWFLLGKERIRRGYTTVLFVFTGYLFVEIGRAMVSIFFGSNFFSAFLGFLGTDALSALLGLLIILIARKQNGLFEDQISYLLRIDKEEQNRVS